MAVQLQAQFPLNAFSIRSNALDENQVQFQHPGSSGVIFNGGTVFSDPESELTCNVSRKRNREGIEIMHTTFKSQLVNPHQRSKVLMIDHDQDSYNYNQPIKLDEFIRYENQKLYAMINEMRDKHCRSLLKIIGEKTSKILQEKEAELEKLIKANAFLEQKVKQISEENQMWFNAAKNSEATILSLRLSLEQILLQGKNKQWVEGVGETEGLNDDAQSGCYAAERDNGEMKRRQCCKVCGGSEVDVLVLPCRHLCLCIECQSKVDTCPVCCSVKNATLQVFLS